MTVLFEIFAVIHFIGWAIVLGSYFASLRTPALAKGAFHGAATAVVAGVVMVGLTHASSLSRFENDGKYGVKLLVALVITALAFVAQRQGDKVKPWVKHGVGVLTVANIVIAVFVH